MLLNEKIYFCRKREGLSQEALAELLNVSRQAVSKWETGDALPETGKILLLAKAFHVTADWLLSEDEPEPSPPHEEVMPSPADPPRPHEPSRSWVDSVPGVLQTLIRRYGWLLGVRLAVAGALFAAFGVVIRLVSRTVISAPVSPFSGDFYGQLYGGFDSVTVSASNGFTVISGFVIFLGVVMLISGVVLAVLLKNDRHSD